MLNINQRQGASEGFRVMYLSEKPPASKPEMFADSPELLTVQHISNTTGLSEQTIRREIAEGNLPGCKIGRRWFVPKASFIEYVNGGGKNA